MVSIESDYVPKNGEFEGNYFDFIWHEAPLKLFC